MNILPKFSRDKMQRRVAKWLKVDRRRIGVTYKKNRGQAEPWTGLTTFGNPAVVTLTFNGDARSDKTDHGLRIRTWNHYETHLVGHGHEFRHVKAGSAVPNGEYLATEAERKVLRKHRRSWFVLFAFFVRP